LKLLMMIKKQITYLFLLCIAFILISCEKEVFTGNEVETKPENAKIIIRSNPSGALIYYNNRYMGIKTPDSLTWLSSGEQKFVLKKNLYFDETITATLTDKKTTDVFLDYALNPAQYGDVSCLSFTTGLSIYINGVNTGYTTPHTFSHMVPGYYSIKYSKRGLRDDSTVVTVEAGTLKNTNFILQDTSRWVDYRTTNSKLLTDYCYSIISDKNNVKWVGSGRGVNSFDGRYWKSFDETNSVLRGPILKLVVDLSGNIWAASSNGLFKYNGSAWIDYTGNLASSNVTGIACDSKGVIWISTYAGIAKYNGASWVIYRTSSSGLFDEYVNCITAAPDGKIWFGALNGIGTFDGQNWTSTSISRMGLDATIGSNIRDIYADAYGVIWVSHYQAKGIRGGLTKFDGTRWSEVTFAIMPNNEIASINVDSNNRKWLSTTTGLGMFVQPVDIKLFLKLDTAVPCRNIYSSCMDKNEDVWFATLGDGIVKIKKGNY
jgi:streptogramin lyase